MCSSDRIFLRTLLFAGHGGEGGRGKHCHVYTRQPCGALIVSHDLLTALSHFLEHAGLAPTGQHMQNSAPLPGSLKDSRLYMQGFHVVGWSWQENAGSKGCARPDQRCSTLPFY